MRLLLISPLIDYNVIQKEYSFEAYLPPLGLLYLASSLEKQGHKVILFDFIAEKYTEEKLKNALVSIDIVGITIISQLVTSTAKLIDEIKKINPNISVIVGGPHCSIQGRQTLHEMKADVVVIGDGEEAIIDIVDALSGKKKLSKINGIFYRENGKIKHGLPAKEVEDLDTLEFPAHHLIEKYNYGKKTVAGVSFLTRGKITSISTSRGCPFRCRFCISKSIAKKCRLRSAENVVKELEEISKNYDSVYAVDDNFLMDKKRAYKIMDMLIEKKLDLDIWIMGARVSDADKSLFKKMKKAGVKSLEFGIESGNQEVLDYYNKKITLEQIEKTVELSKKSGFLTVGNFILGSPIETEKHIDDTINFAKKINPDFAFFFTYNYLKGSEIWDDAFREGKIKENDMFVLIDSRRGLGNFTPEELRKQLNKAYRSYYLTPKYILSQLIRQIFVYENLRIFQAGLRLFLKQKGEMIFDKR